MEIATRMFHGVGLRATIGVKHANEGGSNEDLGCG